MFCKSVRNKYPSGENEKKSMETQFTKEECGSGNIQTKQTETTFILLVAK